jgi:hypothetical protein
MKRGWCCSLFHGGAGDGNKGQMSMQQGSMHKSTSSLIHITQALNVND